MTLGPKFFCSSKMAVTRRRSKLWWHISHQSKALDVSYLSSLSKRDLKHSGTFFKNLHATLDSQLMKYLAEKAPAGRLSGSNYMIIYDFWSFLYDYIWFLKLLIWLYTIFEAFYMIIYDFWSFLYDYICFLKIFIRLYDVF